VRRQEQQRQQAWQRQRVQQRERQQEPQQQARGLQQELVREQEPALLFYRKQPRQQQRSELPKRVICSCEKTCWS